MTHADHDNDLIGLAEVRISKKPEPKVQAALDLGKSSAPRPSLANVVRVLEHDSRWDGRVQKNLFDGHITLDKKPLDDVRETGIALWLDEVYDMRPSSSILQQALRWVASANRYHPVRSYLEGLRWDETPRLPQLFSEYFGARPSRLYSQLGSRWLTGAVARILQPGCKLDTLVVLVGRQGSRKSSACRALCPDPSWFSDSPFDLRSKDAYLVLEGVWIYELAVLRSVQSAGAEAVKGFMSSPHDRFRRPYDRHPTRQLRQLIFVGTTNSAAFMGDATGPIRFRPVRTGRIDLDTLFRDRDQLWAEAVVRYRQGEPWWLEPGQVSELAESSAIHVTHDPWEEVVAAWVARHPDPFTTAEALVQALGLKPTHVTRGEENRLGSILRRIGYKKTRARRNGRRDYVWALREGVELVGDAGAVQSVLPLLQQSVEDEG